MNAANKARIHFGVRPSTMVVPLQGTFIVFHEVNFKISISKHIAVNL